jgi:hypothetical protein
MIGKELSLYNLKLMELNDEEKIRELEGFVRNSMSLTLIGFSSFQFIEIEKMKTNFLTAFCDLEL